MSIRAIFFDFGGVILRTEYQIPRQQLAERFNMEYEDIDKAVFGSESARRASIGEITEEAHWKEVLKRFKLSPSEKQAFSDAFFGGDVIDRELVKYIGSLRGKYHVGLISNAWSGLREFLTKEKVINVFDSVTISAEVGVIKPDAKIYQIALEQAKVQANEAVFVDDMLVNIEACEELGMAGVEFRDPQIGLKQLNRILNLK